VRFACPLTNGGTLIWESDFSTTFEQNTSPNSFKSHKYKQLAEIRFPRDPSNSSDLLGFLLYEHDMKNNKGNLE
jgi:hypothetical protein